MLNSPIILLGCLGSIVWRIIVYSFKKFLPFLPLSRETGLIRAAPLGSLRLGVLQLPLRLEVGGTRIKFPVKEA